MTKIAIDVTNGSFVHPNQFIKCDDKWARYLYSTRVTECGKSGKVYVKWTENDSNGEYYAHIFDLIVIDTEEMDDPEWLNYLKDRYNLSLSQLLKSMDEAVTCYYSQQLHYTDIIRKLKGIED